MQAGLYVGSVVFILIIVLILMKCNDHFSHFIIEVASGIKFIDAQNRIPEQLDVYDKHIELINGRKRIYLFVVSILTTSSLSAVSIIFIQGCIFAGERVYPSGACPTSGVLDCFNDVINVRFQCVPNSIVDFNISQGQFAWCYGWIALNQTTDSVLNQLGICGGLLGVIS
ncbi:unnamed protein product, partial [Didymodactylos carnosus]